MTQVINLLGGPGISKSTNAALIYGQMKKAGLKVELVREWVKGMAWQGKVPTDIDQVYIFGKQCKLESELYGKVDWIVTDSPLILNAFYELYYTKNIEDCVIQEAAIKFLKKVEKKGVKFHNFVLRRTKPYKKEGRFQTEKEANEIDLQIVKYLMDNNIHHTVIEEDDDNKAQAIVNKVLSRHP